MATGKRLPNEAYLEYKARLIAEAEVLKVKLNGDYLTRLPSRDEIKKKVKEKIKRLVAFQSK